MKFAPFGRRSMNASQKPTRASCALCCSPRAASTRLLACRGLKSTAMLLSFRPSGLRPRASILCQSHHILPSKSARKAMDSSFRLMAGPRPSLVSARPKVALMQSSPSNGMRMARSPIPPWRLHDLRRTSRSLMARAGVSSDIAERVLGHVLPGIRGVYDRHSYVAEKRDALERLVSLLTSILNPRAQNVVPLRASQ